MRYLKLCIGEWKNASRDKRECSVLRELGAEVFVIAKGEKTSVKEDVAGFPVTRLSARPLGKRMPVALNRVISLFTWASYVRKENFDIISGHDITALLIAYLSNVGKRRKAKLVYDSHEFELGRTGKRGRITTWRICHMERFLMKRCAFSIMVNDTIADEVQRVHRLERRPVVVRSTPNNWVLDEEKIRETRKEILSAMDLQEETFLVMYHGMLLPNRGIENMLRAVAQTEGVAAIVLGNGEEKYLFSLRVLCEELGIKERVLFHPSVPIGELYRYVAAADVGVSLLQPVVKNHIIALPNKFFENIQSLNPVIVSDFPTIGNIVDHYGIGIRVDSTDALSIVAAIEELRGDKALYAWCKENLKKAKEDLCWEKEKEVLKEAYREIMR